MESSSSDEEDEEGPWYELMVVSSIAPRREWTIRRSFDSLYRMDRLLHQCIFDRTVSRLPEMTENLVNEIGSAVRLRLKSQKNSHDDTEWVSP